MPLPEVEVHDAIAPVAAEWDALADRAGALPWLRPGWAQAWWEAFGAGSLDVVSVRRDGRLVAVAPLRRRRGALSSATNWHSPSFGLLAEDDDAKAELAAALLRERPTMLALHFLDAESGDVAAVCAVAERLGYSVLTRPEMRSPYVPTTGDYETYVRAQREGRKVLKELRRQRRRIEREVDERVELRIERDPAALPAMLRLEGSGWKGDSAIDSSEPARRFYEAIARWGAQRGALRVVFLDVGGRPAAADLLLEDGGSLFDLKGGYAPELRPYGPGKLLLAEMLQRAFAGGVRTFELLGSDEPYKRQWTDLARERVLVQAFAPSPTGQVARLAYERARPLAKRALAAYGRARQASSASSARSSS